MLFSSPYSARCFDAHTTVLMMRARQLGGMPRAPSTAKWRRCLPTVRVVRRGRGPRFVAVLWSRSAFSAISGWKRRDAHVAQRPGKPMAALRS